MLLRRRQGQKVALGVNNRRHIPFVYGSHCNHPLRVRFTGGLFALIDKALIARAAVYGVSRRKKLRGRFPPELGGLEGDPGRAGQNSEV